MELYYIEYYADETKELILFSEIVEVETFDDNIIGKSIYSVYSDSEEIFSRNIGSEWNMDRNTFDNLTSYIKIDTGGKKFNEKNFPEYYL